MDSLCIIQDEKETKLAQIRDMAQVYGRTLVAIVAADGDDTDHGLGGIPGISKPRQLHPELKLTGGILIRAAQVLPLEETA